MKSRRRFLAAASALSCFVLFDSLQISAMAKSRPADGPLPDPKKFQAGDLLWPRGVHDWILYASAYSESESSAAQEWEEQKNAFIQKIKSKGAAATPGETGARRILEPMAYRQFKAVYFNAAPIGEMVPYGSDSGLYTGHVAIIAETASDPLIVEAVWGDVKRVRVIRYSDWIRARPNELIWHGRLKGFSAEDREKVSAKALTYEGVKYDFWNFNLSDVSCFYCSKLVWICVKQALGVAVDGNDDADRMIWFSPKQLMRTSAVVLLNNPGSYGGGT